ncbi:MAG: 30S ribosomal protein S20 [Gammaproteobacteria bacterium]|nr:30S ribosomal protein S20 [Gammaproteobacteria bacterium]
MANSAQARKRARQADVHRERNTAQRSNMRTQVKKLLKLIKDGEKDAAAEQLKAASSFLDRAAKRGLIHANKAARTKSRLSARLKSA